MPDLIHPDERLYLELTRCYVLSRRLAEDAVRLLRITLTEYNLLRIVENHPGIRAAEARSRLMATAPSVAQVVKSLEAKNLIERGHSAGDGRSRPMRLSALGKKTVIRARAAVNAALGPMRHSPSSMSALADSLSSLADSLPSSPFYHGSR